MLNIPDWLVFFIKQLGRSKVSFLIVTVLTVTAAICGATAPLLIGRLMDDITIHNGENMIETSILLLGALLLAELCVALRAYVSAKTMIRLSYALTEETLTAVLRTSAAFFTSTARGELIQRCTQDTKVIQQFGLATLPGFAQELLLAGTAMAVISSWNPVLAVVLMAAYIILFIPVHRYGRKRGAARKQMVAHDARLRQSLLEKLETLKQIKLYGTERKEFDHMAAEHTKWADLKFQEGIVDSMYKTFPRIPDSLAPALVFLFAGWQMVQGEASVGQLVTIIAYIPAINAPVRSFFVLYVSFADIKVRIHGILEYLQLNVEPGMQAGLRRPADYREQQISFEDVHVSGARGDLLRKISFTIAPGEHIAVVGPSGSGKSTLLKLLLRLQEPSAGTIRIGGMPIREQDAAHLRSRIGYIQQEGVWFRDTLRRNLTYLGEADREMLDKWMEAFGAMDIVTKLPLGYDSEIGDNGCFLSGGQRQLISLVRMMVKQPDMLLFDEATSSLDLLSETRVYQALDSYASELTRIHVTHRLRGAALADRILVLDQGELVEQGTHEELLRLQGLYADLWHKEHEQTNEAKAFPESEGDTRHEHEFIPTIR